MEGGNNDTKQNQPKPKKSGKFYVETTLDYVGGTQKIVIPERVSFFVRCMKTEKNPGKDSEQEELISLQKQRNFWKAAFPVASVKTISKVEQLEITLDAINLKSPETVVTNQSPKLSLEKTDKIKKDLTPLHTNKPFEIQPSNRERDTRSCGRRSFLNSVITEPEAHMAEKSNNGSSNPVSTKSVKNDECRVSVTEAAIRASLDYPEQAHIVQSGASEEQGSAEAVPMNRKRLTEAAIRASIDNDSPGSTNLISRARVSMQSAKAPTQSYGQSSTTDDRPENVYEHTGKQEQPGHRNHILEAAKLAARASFRDDIISVSQANFMEAHGKLDGQVLPKLEVESPGGEITPSPTESSPISAVSTETPLRSGDSLLSAQVSGYNRFGNEEEQGVDLSSLQVSNLDEKISSSELYHLFPDAISIGMLRREQPNRNSFIIIFGCANAAETALKSVQGKMISGCPLQVMYRKYSK